MYKKKRHGSSFGAEGGDARQATAEAAANFNLERNPPERNIRENKDISFSLQLFLFFPASGEDRLILAHTHMHAQTGRCKETERRRGEKKESAEI